MIIQALCHLTGYKLCPNKPSLSCLLFVFYKWIKVIGPIRTDRQWTHQRAHNLPIIIQWTPLTTACTPYISTSETQTPSVFNILYPDMMQGVREAVKNTGSWAKQAFLRLEVRFLRPDKGKTQLDPGARCQEGEEGVRGKIRSDLLPEQMREEYLSRLSQH